MPDENRDHGLLTRAESRQDFRRPQRIPDAALLPRHSLISPHVYVIADNKPFGRRRLGDATALPLATRRSARCSPQN